LKKQNFLSATNTHLTIWETQVNMEMGVLSPSSQGTIIQLLPAT
jgi:hypothetical protein